MPLILEISGKKAFFDYLIFNPKVWARLLITCLTASWLTWNKELRSAHPKGLQYRDERGGRKVWRPREEFDLYLSSPWKGGVRSSSRRTFSFRVGGGLGCFLPWRNHPSKGGKNKQGAARRESLASASPFRKLPSHDDYVPRDFSLRPLHKVSHGMNG